MFQKTLFDVPIWVKEINNFDSMKSKLCIELSKFPEERNNKFLTNRHIKREGLSETFSKIIYEELNDLYESIKKYRPEIKDLMITDVWSVSYDKGDYQATHNHSSTGLSGILHLDNPSDGPDLNIVMPFTDWIDDTTKYYSVKYKVGTMMVMPSFLLHSSEVNLSDQRKRVISWDMKVITDKRNLFDTTISNWS
tara:strand:- start:183 stop:764 length:582 start_codon:yes stop_codon:yes gene_type:complete